NALVNAHETCRKALTLQTCVDLASSIHDAPARPNVELIPATVPVTGAYLLAINGTPLPPGQVGTLLPGHATTLLEAARALNPTASNVDILAPISGDPYLSMITTPVFPVIGSGIPQPAYYGILGLQWPPYWTGPEQDFSPLWVVHADAQSP